jgi:hypothetical protein
VKFETTPAFDRDFKRLPDQHKKKFRQIVPGFHAAAERVAAGDDDPWPKGLRVKPIQSARGVMELTWSMSDPDGRATWEWTRIGGQPAVRWRRIGGHGVLDKD